MSAPRPPGSTVWARLNLNDASGWPEARRKAVALWLRKQARELTRNGDKYQPNFVARYMRD